MGIGYSCDTSAGQVIYSDEHMGWFWNWELDGGWRIKRIRIVLGEGVWFRRWVCYGVPSSDGNLIHGSFQEINIPELPGERSNVTCNHVASIRGLLDRESCLIQVSAENPCPDCVYLAKNSPYTSETLPTTPKTGVTRCRSWCYCTLRVQKVSKRRYNAVRKRNKSAKWHLRKIKQQQQRDRKTGSK